MEKRFPFLTADWLNLALVNYRVDPAMLQPLVPPGCRLDLINGNAFASLVAFDFFNTRVMGLRWPGFVNFPEINLRFYVRHGEDRGVCFVREFVPHKTIANLARWIYNEPYLAAPMSSEATVKSGTVTVRHTLTTGGRNNSLEVVASTAAFCPSADSFDAFIKDQEWGFGTSRSGRLIRYHVKHPVWNVHPVQSYKLDWDWSAVYGPHWASMQEMEPVSVNLVQGSSVKVFPKRMQRS